MAYLMIWADMAAFSTYLWRWWWPTHVNRRRTPQSLSFLHHKLRTGDMHRFRGGISRQTRKPHHNDKDNLWQFHMQASDFVAYETELRASSVEKRTAALRVVVNRSSLTPI